MPGIIAVTGSFGYCVSHGKDAQPSFLRSISPFQEGPYMIEPPRALDADAVRALAMQHGFDDVRVTSAEPHLAGQDIFNRWLANAKHADMQWLEKDPDRRTTPDAHVPSARSVITFAVSYFRDRPESVSATSGKVALYAAGKDYHKVIDRNLKAFCRDLREAVDGTEARFYVDYGPVLERAFAERAGLGFVGRSANLIHPTFGTYVFIATVITNLELATDSPGEGTCGQCQRCIDVCPTGALKTPYEIDAGLCISYLTIENKGPIPRRLRPLIGEWIFGCDLCQEVCPYNAKAHAGASEAITVTHIAGTELSLSEILGIRDDVEFSERFAGSPVRRAKRHGLLRNAAVVAGNSGDRDLVPALVEALADDHPLVRGHAVWALGALGAADRARDVLRDEHDAFVCSELDGLTTP